MYSNSNYWILARLVEVISGVEFTQYLEENIFTPLGMNDTLTMINAGDYVEGLSQGYVTAYGTAISWSELEKMFAGSGGVISTVADMGKWLSMHTNEGKNMYGERLLSKSLLEESYSPQPGSPKYGLGWFLNSLDIKSPMPKIIDLSLAFITITYLFFGIKGIKQSKKWTIRCKKHSDFRYYLRLMPQIVSVSFIGWLFFVVPNLQNNSSIIKDAFGIWLAAMLFLIVVFLIGVVVTVMRMYYRKK